MHKAVLPTMEVEVEAKISKHIRTKIIVKFNRSPIGYPNTSVYFFFLRE